MLLDQAKLISGGQALEILRQETGRPNASRQSLKYLVDAGKIDPIRIHPRFNLYDPAEVRRVARALVSGGAE